MQNLTPVGENIVNDLAQRYQLSYDAVMHMLIAVNHGSGSMAQFNSPELGGSGQWMRGGMTMVGDMFNTGLQARVDNLCNELSQALANHQIFPVPQYPEQGHWWPAELGEPFSTGAQNTLRYAIFPQRLAIENLGQLTIYDTLDHQISGVSQQQGSDQSLCFTSQYGTVFVSSLPLVGDAYHSTEQANTAGTAALRGENVSAPIVAHNQTQPVAPAVVQTSAPAQQAVDNSLDSDRAIELIEKLAQLHASGVLTQEEFDNKKRELMTRI